MKVPIISTSRQHRLARFETVLEAVDWAREMVCQMAPHSTSVVISIEPGRNEQIQARIQWIEY